MHIVSMHSLRACTWSSSCSRHDRVRPAGENAGPSWIAGIRMMPNYRGANVLRCWSYWTHISILLIATLRSVSLSRTCGNLAASSLVGGYWAKELVTGCFYHRAPSFQGVYFAVLRCLNSQILSLLQREIERAPPSPPAYPITCKVYSN